MKFISPKIRLALVSARGNHFILFRSDPPEMVVPEMVAETTPEVWDVWGGSGNRLHHTIPL